MRLTPFGKFTRKLRVDNDELLKDMANNLNVTVSYLSAVEIGKRNVPEKWANMIIESYNLDDSKSKELKEAILYSSKSIKLNTSDLEEDKLDLVYALARELKDLDTDKIINIKKILLNE